MPAEAEQNSTYEGELRGAQNADLSSVENRGIIKVFRDRNGHLVLDNTGNAVVILVPALVPDEEEAWEKCFQLFLRETHQLAQSGYRIVYVHSGFATPLWFAWWVTRLRSRVSRAHRKNIKALTVVHPTTAARLFFLGLRPILGSNFWSKLHYADRLEELWLDDILPEHDVKLNIPDAVATYEGKIVEEAEEMRDMARLLGAPLASRDSHFARPDGEVPGD